MAATLDTCNITEEHTSCHPCFCFQNRPPLLQVKDAVLLQDCCALNIMANINICPDLRQY